MEKAARVSFYDVHERERQPTNSSWAPHWTKGAGKGGFAHAVGEGEESTHEPRSYTEQSDHYELAEYADLAEFCPEILNPKSQVGQ